MQSHESVMIEIDPALGMDAETARVLERNLERAGRNVAVFLSSVYPAALAAEPLRSDRGAIRILLRAATAEEVLAAHDGALDGPRVLERMIEWQEISDGDIIFERAAVLWTGEVLVSREWGSVASPFYVMEAAAEAWAFHEALRFPRNDVCGAQVISWHCAESLARGVIDNAADYDRLSRFWTSPIRVVSAREVWLPWDKGER
jgi:hypothetical protein